MEQAQDPGTDGERPWQQEFDGVIRARRQAAGVQADAGASWGLALSGGGIRSATFCLGLIRGLARNRVLKRFDYLSTVSGGGYIGASLGRLYGQHANAAQVEHGVARDDSLWLWWLRANGRYLTPAGARDLGQASASILRGVLATHGELGVLLLMLAAMIVLPHVLAALFPPVNIDTPAVLQWAFQLGPDWLCLASFFGRAGSAWWWWIALPLFAMAHQIFGYWFRRERDTLPSRACIILGVSFALALGYIAMRWALRELQVPGDRVCPTPGEARYAGANAALITALLLLAPLTAWLTTVFAPGPVSSLGQYRLLRTKRLATCMWIVGLMVVAGTIDLASWELGTLFRKITSGDSYKTVLVGLVALLTVGRTLLPPLQEWFSRSRKRHESVQRILNMIGIAVTLLIVLLWTTLVQALVFSSEPPDAPPNWQSPYVDGTIWLGVLVIAALYVVLTRRSFDLLNLASLHNFYRARIERAYVSSGNSELPGARFRASMLAPVSRELTGTVVPLTETVAGDDVDLSDYQPHLHGGPVHLINCCINQSVDDRTGNYNADRKGIALTVSALGIETGVHMPEAAQRMQAQGTLSRWIAISGAAASTGMGSRTSPGLASMLFMSGLRLGYWIENPFGRGNSHADRSGMQRVRQMFFDWFPKPVAIVAEAVARFPGLRSSAWYISDGGHFDNTGIYALLKREVRLIVAADCGADPKYLFGDLENLVRKADIDYGAKIEFLDPRTLNQCLSGCLCERVGTPETIGPEPSPKCLVIGRIRYASGAIGTLVIVKPRRLDKMPFDIVAYADRNETFPQQGTGDQFFDETQWESYHQLGLLIGKLLTEEVLEQARECANATRARPANSSLASAQAAKETPSTRRQRMTDAVKTTVGAGVSLSLLLALWQGWEQYRQSTAQQAMDDDGRYTQMLDRLTASTGDMSTVTAADFQQLLDELASRDRGDRAQTLVDALVRCARNPDTKRSAQRDACNRLTRRIALHRPAGLRYWPDPQRYLAAQALLELQTEESPTDPQRAPARSKVGSVQPLAKPCAEPARVQAYLHIYGETGIRAAARLEPKLRDLGAEVRGIENLGTSQRGRAASYRWPEPVNLVSGPISWACVREIEKSIPGVQWKRAPESSNASAGLALVEIWLPSQRRSRALQAARTGPPSSQPITSQAPTR